MSDRRVFDCVVVGAGPAGSLLAGELVKGGLDVLILEKDTLPRYKACGGGITVKAAKMLRETLGVEFSGSIEDSVTAISVTHRGTDRIDLSSEHPIAYMVQREVFDEHLARRAVDAGASLARGTVLGVDRYEKGFELHTDSGDYQARFLAGADGATSIVARCLGLASPHRMAAAIEADLDPGPERMAHFHGRAVLDYGAAHYGYGWVFPKAKHLSVGVGTFGGKGSLVRAFDEFLAREQLDDARVIRKKGHLIPIWTGNRTVHAEGALLVGDAARVVDPFTGEGIHNAAASARLAAQSILEAVTRGDRDLSQYSALIASELSPHLKLATVANHVFYPFSGAWHRFLRSNPTIYYHVIKLVQGEVDYRSLASMLKASFKDVMGLAGHM